MIEGIGPKSNAMLAKAGLISREQLLKIGSVQAFLKVKAAGCNPSLNFLWGLESVITGQHWREVAKHSRTALLMELEERSQPNR
jgi:DNA transformation protein